MKIAPNAENLCVVFWKKCVLELQFECKAGIGSGGWWMSYMLWLLCLKYQNLCVNNWEKL